MKILLMKTLYFGMALGLKSEL
jgi:hypothetical protein